jgi:hypothetical protein
MKTKILSLALVAALAFVGANAVASSLTLNVSGSAQVQGTNGPDKGIIKTLSFNEKNVYSIISNAVASARSYDTNLASISISLPANGYIAFDPRDSDNNVTGFFYVTNKTGFYFPLSGLATNVFNTNSSVLYYNFAELDTILNRGATNGIDNNYWGFYHFSAYFNPTVDFNSVASYSLSSKTASGSDKSVSQAVLYIHDNPFAYGEPPNDQNNYYNPETYPLDPFSFNNTAIEVEGLLTASLTIKTNSVAGGTLSLSGSGNFSYAETNSGVATGKATLTVVP